MGRTLEDVAAELYGLPLADFTPRRGELAKQLRPAERALSETVARLPKPALSAWAVNRYARSCAGELDELLALGEQLREAQSELAGDRLKTLTANTQALVRRTLRGVAQVASDEGSALSDALLGQVEQTLRAALADDGAAAAVRAGVLTKPLSPPGFGPVDLSGAVAVIPAARPRQQRKLAVVRPSADERRSEAKRAAEAALAELEAAQHELTAREEDLRVADEQHAAAKRRHAELKADLDEAERALGAAGEKVRNAKQGHQAAERRASKAEDAAKRAKKAVDAVR